MRIGEVTRLFEISRDTLLELEARRLITPGRTPGGHRLYTRQTIKQIAAILHVPLPYTMGGLRTNEE